MVVFVVFFESRGAKNGDARSLKVETSETFDELKEHAEGEGEFGESASRSLVDAEVVIAIVFVFFFHGITSNITKKPQLWPGL
jgi:hypothetical protein